MNINIELLLADLERKIRAGELARGPNLGADLRRTVLENAVKPEPRLNNSRGMFFPLFEYGTLLRDSDDLETSEIRVEKPEPENPRSILGNVFLCDECGAKVVTAGEHPPLRKFWGENIIWVSAICGACRKKSSCAEYIFFETPNSLKQE